MGGGSKSGNIPRVTETMSRVWQPEPMKIKPGAKTNESGISTCLDKRGRSDERMKRKSKGRARIEISKSLALGDSPERVIQEQSEDCC